MLEEFLSAFGIVSDLSPFINECGVFVFCNWFASRPSMLLFSMPSLTKPIDTFEIAVVYVQVEPAIGPGACIQRDKDPAMMGYYALPTHLLRHLRPNLNPTLTSVLDVC